MHPNARPLEEAQRQLSLILEQQEQLAPALYRDLALYLQVLRDGLLPAVQQACFHLATQVVPERYQQLPQARRIEFQQRLGELVQRCSSLLTVEQLMGLAAQQQRRSHRQRQQQRDRLLDALIEEEPGPTSASSPSPIPAFSAGAGAGSADRPAGAPSASVELSLDLPVSADLFERGIPGLSAPHPIERPGGSAQRPDADAGAPDHQEQPADPTVGSDAPLDASGQPPTDSASGLTGEPSVESTGESITSGEGSSQPMPAPEGSELQLLQSLFQMAAQGLQSPAGADTSSPEGALEVSMAARLEPLPAPDPSVTGSAPPRDPVLQLSWWRHFDRALARRLRNLSHAVNVEMMRVGLAQGLLPLNLLDAVLEGQIEALPAPANLLRLPLPLPADSGGPGEVLTLLLRSADLEYEQLRLRTCRRRLEQRRRALRTMAKRYRIWQRRVTALEAEQQWYRDSAQLQSRQLPSNQG